MSVGRLKNPVTIWILQAAIRAHIGKISPLQLIWVYFVLP